MYNCNWSNIRDCGHSIGTHLCGLIFRTLARHIAYVPLGTPRNVPHQIAENALANLRTPTTSTASRKGTDGMSKLNIIENCSNFHFIGIGGIHMSGLAEILHREKYGISGSDRDNSENVARLNAAGIKVKIGHNAQNIPADCEIVVYNAAIPWDNEEMLAAKTRGLRLMDRAELVGRLMQNYTHAICVAGTHGKTTTTSMLSVIFMAANTNPTVLNGGILAAMGGALRIGGRDVFIAEACEYHNSFLKFFPTTGVILNMEMDHSDFFPDFSTLSQSFLNFAKKIPKDGMLVINGESGGLNSFLKGVNSNICVFGTSGGLTAQNLSFDQRGCSVFDVVRDGKLLGGISLAVPGRHNVQNALAACACALGHGIAFPVISQSLATFTGAQRRFQRVGEFMGAEIVDDYAHHPTEIAATLSAAKKIAHRRLWAVFQPHTNTRTRQFLSEFAKSLAAADESIVLDIYSPAGREENDRPIHAKDLVREVQGLGMDSRYMPNFDAAKEYLTRHVQPGDIVITMGAGNIGELAHKLVQPPLIAGLTPPSLRA